MHTSNTNAAKPVRHLSVHAHVHIVCLYILHWSINSRSETIIFRLLYTIKQIRMNRYQILCVIVISPFIYREFCCAPIMITSDKSPQWVVQVFLYWNQQWILYRIEVRHTDIQVKERTTRFIQSSIRYSLQRVFLPRTADKVTVFILVQSSSLRIPKWITRFREY